jgi:VanZ family protein
LKKFFRINLWGILWGVFILILISIPGDLLPEIPPFVSLFEPDKLVHLFLFCIYVILLIRGFKKQDIFIRVKRNAVFIAILNGIILGGGTEILQYYFIPGRICSIYDFIANVLGCFAGWWLFSFSTRRHKDTEQ